MNTDFQFPIFPGPQLSTVSVNCFLPPPPLRRTLTSTMPTGFDEAFRRVKELAATFRANKIVASSLWLECIGAQRRHYTPAKIKTVEGNVK
jgi:hypothetical protein